MAERAELCPIKEPWVIRTVVSVDVINVGGNLSDADSRAV